MDLHSSDLLSPVLSLAHCLLWSAFEGVGLPQQWTMFCLFLSLKLPVLCPIWPASSCLPSVVFTYVVHQQLRGSKVQLAPSALRPEETPAGEAPHKQWLLWMVAWSIPVKAVRNVLPKPAELGRHSFMPPLQHTGRCNSKPTAAFHLH